MTNEPVVLAIDDEPPILRLLKLELTAQGFKVITATSAQEAREVMNSIPPNIILLDLLLPTESGVDFLKRLRKSSNLPVIIVSAKNRASDKIYGFEAGADDYVTKPFDVEELGVRIKAILRRSEPSPSAKPITIGNLVIDLWLRKVTLGGVDVKLNKSEWSLLEQFAQNPDRIMTQVDLLTRTWGPEYRDDASYLRTYVNRLRIKIGDTDKAVIKTKVGLGYVLDVSGTR